MLLSLSLGSLAVLAGGCASLESRQEREVVASLKGTGEERQALETNLLLPASEAPASEWLRFALLKHPAVKASYFEWQAAVASIAPARALPDPQLSLQADLSNMVMSFMPGVMFDLMLPSKRAAMARELSAGAEVSHRAYLVAALRVAGEVQKTWVDLAFVEESLRLKKEQARILRQAAMLASADYRSGMAMGSLESQMRQEEACGRVEHELESLKEQRLSLRQAFKAALGLLPGDPDPMWPSPQMERSPVPEESELWKAIQLANPDLARMRAMVDMAVTQESIARQGRVPDFTAGVMVDFKQAPLMWRPSATMTLPIWRGKIEAQIAAAKARREAAEASVNAELLNMSAELARMLFMVREADHMLSYMDEVALPRLAQVQASAQAGLRSGMAKAGMLSEARSMELSMRLERLSALREREQALVSLQQMSASAFADSGLKHLR